MAVAHVKPNLLDALQRDEDAASVDGSEQIFLTPYLALACGLLYMMASDGELEAQESSQLQAVLGGDQAVLGYALRYVQSVKAPQFFATAAELLSVKDKWCILTNVCDALLADGRAEQAELALFAQMSAAFGVSEAQFEPYFKILALKNDKSILGKYAGVRGERQPMTPHFALAISLLYMLTADGSIGAQEIGQLEAVVGEFDGLQNVALKYVRSVKLKQFLDEASALLKPEQKIYILTNVCDSMLSDGEVAHLEDKLFFQMLTAFGFTEKTFARYFQVLETKNLKPFDISAFKNRVTHERLTASDDADGVTFKNELRHDGSTTVNGLPDAANQGVWVGAAENTQMSQFIARTMDDNIQSVSDGFGNQGNVVQVGLNATDALNLQKVGGDADASNNRQRVDSAALADNVQKIEASTQDANRQQVASASAVANRQSIEGDAIAANLQTIAVDTQEANRASISPEIRLQNIHEVAEAVHQRLDRFEVAHAHFLKIGRAHKFTDAFALLEDDASDTNRQLVDASFARMGLGFSPPDVGAGSNTNSALDVAPNAMLLKGAASTASMQGKEERAALVKQKASATGRAHWRDGVISRRRGIVYVRLVVATLAIAFAAPIETRGLWRRAVTGPLILTPIVMPDSNTRQYANESDLPSLREEQALR